MNIRMVLTEQNENDILRKSKLFYLYLIENNMHRLLLTFCMFFLTINFDIHWYWYQFLVKVFIPVFYFFLKFQFFCFFCLSRIHLFIWFLLFPYFLFQYFQNILSYKVKILSVKVPKELMERSKMGNYYVKIDNRVYHHDEILSLMRYWVLYLNIISIKNKIYS